MDPWAHCSVMFWRSAFSMRFEAGLVIQRVVFGVKRMPADAGLASGFLHETCTVNRAIQIMALVAATGVQFE